MDLPVSPPAPEGPNFTDITRYQGPGPAISRQFSAQGDSGESAG